MGTMQRHFSSQLRADCSLVLTLRYIHGWTDITGLILIIFGNLCSFVSVYLVISAVVFPCIYSRKPQKRPETGSS
jgi:hypothetical protein